MKFHTLAISNFLTVGNATVNLADRGLHLIQGVNDDNSSALSNGAGKSSIVDAISWVLFGVTARGLKGDKVVNNTKKKDCVVSLSVSNGASEYHISRYRKHATHKNALRIAAQTAAGEVDMTKGTDAETQKVVEQILGCSWEVFKAAVYSAQEDMPDLPRKTDKELKMLIEESAGMQRIERAYELARGRKNEAEKALSLAENTLTLTNANLARSEQQLDGATTNRDQWEAERATRVAVAQQAIDDATATLKTKAQDLAARKPKYDEAIADRAAIDKQLADHGKLERAATEAEAVFNRANLAVDRGGLTSAKMAVESCEYQIANADEFVGQPCEACGKPGDANDRAHFLEHKRQQLELLKRKLEEKKAEVANQARIAAEAKQAAERMRVAVPDVTAITAKRKVLSGVIDTYDRDRSDAITLKAHIDGALKDTLTHRKTEANPHDRVVETLRDSVNRLHTEVTVQTQKRDEAKVRLQTLEDVCRVFGPGRRARPDPGHGDAVPERAHLRLPVGAQRRHDPGSLDHPEQGRQRRPEGEVLHRGRRQPGRRQLRCPVGRREAQGSHRHRARAAGPGGVPGDPADRPVDR
jgi:DNA repair exonuclease SbcCD ATPase subunit